VVERRFAAVTVDLQWRRREEGRSCGGVLCVVWSSSVHVLLQIWSCFAGKDEEMVDLARGRDGAVCGDDGRWFAAAGCVESWGSLVTVAAIEMVRG